MPDVSLKDFIVLVNAVLTQSSQEKDWYCDMSAKGQSHRELKSPALLFGSALFSTLMFLTIYCGSKGANDLVPQVAPIWLWTTEGRLENLKLDPLDLWEALSMAFACRLLVYLVNVWEIEGCSVDVAQFVDIVLLNKVTVVSLILNKVSVVIRLENFMYHDSLRSRS